MHMPRLQAPIVLVHGLFGFDRFQLGNWLLGEYFRGLPDALRAAGNRVFVAQVSKTAGIASRAAQLKGLLDLAVPGEPVHLFGHSMGGLDARYMISRLGMADRVLTLTTLGTPHRGSPFADWALTHLLRLVIPVLDNLEIPKQAFFDLTTTSCAKFNAETPDAPGVRYFSVAGDYTLQGFNPAWRLTAPLITRTEGPNDGIVSIASATWGERVEVWEGDHMSLVNWPEMLCSKPQHDRIPHYADLLQRLVKEGY